MLFFQRVASAVFWEAGRAFFFMFGFERSGGATDSHWGAHRLTTRVSQPTITQQNGLIQHQYFAVFYDFMIVCLYDFMILRFYDFLAYPTDINLLALYAYTKFMIL